MALINIKGYSLNNERNAVYKQLDKPLATLTTDYLPLTGNFRDSIDIVNPELYIDFTGIDCPYYKINYIVIDSFNRRYFVEKVEFVSNKLFKFYLKEDVLYLFESSNITTAKVFVDRNETYFNPLLEDNLTNFIFKKTISYVDYNDIYYPGSGLTQFTTTYDYPLIVWVYDGQHNNVTSNLIETLPADENYNAIDSIMTGNTRTNYQVLRVRDTNELRDICDVLIATEEARTFTKGIYLCPISFNNMPTTTIKPWDVGQQNRIYVGTANLFSTRDEQGNALDYTGLKYVINRVKVAEFNYNLENNNYFLNFEPYTTYEIFLPYYGYTEISANYLLGKKISVYYILNFDNGESIVQVLSEGKLIFTGKCNVLIKLPISSSNLETINAQRTSNDIVLASNFIGSSVLAALGIATGNPVIAAGGVVGAGSAIVNNISKSQQLITKGNTQVISRTDGLNNQQFVSLRITKQVPIGYNEDYFAKYGRPFKSNMRLIDLKGTGFTKIDKVEFDYISSTATNKVNVLTEELDELESILKKGIIYNTPNN